MSNFNYETILDTEKFVSNADVKDFTIFLWNLESNSEEYFSWKF